MASNQDPSPEEITAACLIIQATWSPDERLRRLRVDLRPTVRCADGRLVSVTADDYDGHQMNHEALVAADDG